MQIVILNMIPMQVPIIPEGAIGFVSDDESFLPPMMEHRTVWEWDGKAPMTVKDLERQIKLDIMFNRKRGMT